MSVLVTGATGFVGGVVLDRLGDAVALARGPGAAARLPGRRVLEGDLTGPLPLLPPDVTAIVHCAASVSFTLPLAEARAINVEGTRRLLAAAARLPRLERFVHVSTAYVAGRTDGRFAEDDAHGEPRNTYERSKQEAEAAVRASGLPWTIVRPSIVVGDSETGVTRSFNVLYHPLRAFARGLVRRVPADPDGLLDVVPVDHVADVVEAALAGHGPVLHAVAAERAVTTSQLASMAAAVFGRPAPEFTPGGGGQGLEAYFPYFGVRTRFTAEHTRELALDPPPLPDYFDRLVAYAQEVGWGRRERARAA